MWRFTFIDANNTQTVIDEPVGWDGVAFNFERNRMHHGIFTNVTTNDFEFVGDGFDLLYTEYNLNGANGFMELLIEYECEAGDGYSTYFQGKFDFNTLERQCLDYCFIKCSVTTTRCADVFLSRMGQDVNIQATTNFDGDPITPPTPRVLNIKGQDIFVQNKADNKDGDNFATLVLDTTNLGGDRFYYIPISLPNNPIMEFGEYNVNNVSPAIVFKNEGVDNVIAFPMTSQDDIENYFNNLYLYQPATNECINDVDYNWRTKGEFQIIPNYNGTISITLRATRSNPYGTSSGLGAVVIATSVPLTNGVQTTIAFDEISSGTFSNGSPLDYVMFYWFINIFKTTASALDQTIIGIDYDSGSVNYFNMEANSACGTSTATSYYLPEVLKFLPAAYMGADCPAVTMEAELNQCLDYFQVTKGSFLRNVTEPSTPQLFTNYEFMFDNCRKIFNIGWGFNDNDQDFLIARIDQFYQSTVVADVGLLDKATFTTAKDLIYGTITIGYNKWEAEEYNGLDEMNTQRQYRRDIDSNPSELELMSDIITAGYTIEVTRRKNQANTGTSDWRYDDDIFLINAFVFDDLLYAYRGIDASPAFVYSPSTRMNFVLTPVRNLLRWFKTLSAPTPNVANEQQLFQSGTGNYIAGGQMLNFCPVEDEQIYENSIVTTAIIDNVYYETPIWKTIYATFDAPLSMAQFEAIKTNYYGAIRFRCANDLYLGNIVTLSHDPNKGIASFKLLLRR
jgi:hypothetical protein